MTRQEAQATPDVVTGTLSIFGDDARVLIDPGATHSFISREYVARVGMTQFLRDVVWTFPRP